MNNSFHVVFPPKKGNKITPIPAFMILSVLSDSITAGADLFLPVGGWAVTPGLLGVWCGSSAFMVEVRGDEVRREEEPAPCCSCQWITFWQDWSGSKRALRGIGPPGARAEHSCTTLRPTPPWKGKSLSEDTSGVRASPSPVLPVLCFVRGEQRVQEAPALAGGFAVCFFSPTSTCPPAGRAERWLHDPWRALGSSVLQCWITFFKLFVSLLQSKD